MPRLWSYLFIFTTIFTLSQTARGAGMGDAIVLFAFGDSLTAGYGLPGPQAFPVKLQAALRAKGINVEVVNAGVSGDTSGEGLARLDWSLPAGADAAIVEFGANDAFRGVPVATMRANLSGIVERLQSRHIEVMLAGMLAPRNMGAAYTDAFDATFGEIAGKYDCILYPFYLDGVALDRSLNQPDQIHPNAAGVDVIVARILPAVEQLIDRVRKVRAAADSHSAP
jgi:acyl-CoA thioesterase-1